MSKHKIQIPARFVVCVECKESEGYPPHGYIMYSDGSVGEIATSRENALENLEQARRAGRILDCEMVPVRRQILNSALPHSLSEEIVAVFSLVGNDGSITEDDWAFGEPCPN